jgi:hypothetical protein
MKVVPLGLTALNWPELDTFISDATDISPIRFFDENKIRFGDIYSHIIALELFSDNENKRIEFANQSLQHINLTVGIECEENEIVLLNDIFARKITRYNMVNRRQKYFSIMTMTLLEWKEVIIKYCRRSVDFDMRLLFNQLYQMMCQANLAEIFNAYDVEMLNDSSFFLKELR